MTTNKFNRRTFLLRAFTSGSLLLLAGCERLSRSEWFPKVLDSAEKLTQATQHLIAPRQAMAQEFTEADLSPQFRSNGTSNPENPQYQALAANSFADYRLQVGGLVARPTAFSLTGLRSLPSRTQITRHDCVEGWSAIGKWKGTPLSVVLARVQPKPEARYVVFYCADPMDGQGTRYYESIDMDDAHHPQTILAYELNDQPLPVANGAPVRVRIERQLGYKMAKYIMGIRLVDSFANIGGGKGGYWEDQGYEWYAGI
ncbi:molybdopterin oxidoreductase [Sulfuriferula plumbiphila]|uniref:Molybdopterin oxidoreductase n=1 Tax=Sulfuriferula plumbiphila TaxID=171865 RepID=A0A512L8Z5_9PROT|nr:molybdopterin-binding protein [Sulfuriferula plumbiphila]BBP04434.1 molybdopterin oxidoreductase [Sulfuriferula plumbiphila]GEP30949.1 molybdopterin oxidoreductase [Sulfuriferula plumbiphila]